MIAGIQKYCQKYAFHGNPILTLKRGVGGFFVLVMPMLYSLTSHAQFAPIGQFQLAPPNIEVSETFFDALTKVSLDLDVTGVELRYTLTGEEVTKHSALYQGPIELSNSATIKAKAFHSDYQTSEAVNVRVFKTTKEETISWSYTPDPASQYSGQGAKSLADFRKGSMNFRDGHWLGFSGDTIVFEVDTKTQIKQLTLSVLEDHGSWIFAPTRIEVWQGPKQTGTWMEESPDTFAPKSFQFIEVPLDSPVRGTTQLLVIMEKIPDWHDGKGTTPWLFIDEIFISN